MVRDHIFPLKPLELRLCFSCTGVWPFTGSSKIELPSTLAESDAYPTDRALHVFPRQGPLPLAGPRLPKGTELELGRDAHLGNTILNQPYRRRVSTDRLNHEDGLLAATLEGKPGPTPAGMTLPYRYPKTRFRRERVWLTSDRLLWRTHAHARIYSR